MAEEEVFTADQVAVLARELRQAAGTEPEVFGKGKVVSMMRDEIRLLRERGFTDDRIASLFTGFDVPLTGEELTRLDAQAAG